MSLPLSSTSLRSDLNSFDAHLEQFFSTLAKTISDQFSYFFAATLGGIKNTSLSLDKNNFTKSIQDTKQGEFQTSFASAKNISTPIRPLRNK